MTNVVSRFKSEISSLTETGETLHNAIMDKAIEIEALYSQVKPGLYHALSMACLEESLMWIIKGLKS